MLSLPKCQICFASDQDIFWLHVECPCSESFIALDRPAPSVLRAGQNIGELDKDSKSLPQSNGNLLVAGDKNPLPNRLSNLTDLGDMTKFLHEASDQTFMD